MQLINDAQEAHALALRPSGEVNLERFAQLLAMRGHHVWLRTGRLDCGCGQVALRHTFVLAGASGMHSALNYCACMQFCRKLKGASACACGCCKQTVLGGRVHLFNSRSCSAAAAAGAAAATAQALWALT
jgi:hypothetical protein